MVEGPGLKLKCLVAMAAERSDLRAAGKPISATPSSAWRPAPAGPPTDPASRTAERSAAGRSAGSRARDGSAGRAGGPR